MARRRKTRKIPAATKALASHLNRLLQGMVDLPALETRLRKLETRLDGIPEQSILDRADLAARVTRLEELTVVFQEALTACGNRVFQEVKILPVKGGEKR